MSEREETKVYISYSRKDKEFARRIVERLEREQISVWVDWKDIPTGSEWAEEIERGIETSDAYIFIMSPDSLKSKVMDHELKHAVKINKRVIPLVIRDVDYKEVPIEIASINWLYMRQEDNFEDAFLRLKVAIQTDIPWVKQHSYLLILARDWVANNRETSYLLRGQNYQDTLQTVTANNGREPFLTDLQREYLLASQPTGGYSIALGLAARTRLPKFNQMPCQSRRGRNSR